MFEVENEPLELLDDFVSRFAAFNFLGRNRNQGFGLIFGIFDPLRRPQRVQQVHAKLWLQQKSIVNTVDINFNKKIYFSQDQRDGHRGEMVVDTHIVDF